MMNKGPALSLEVQQLAPEPPRDFLEEAMKILRGETMLRPQRQHLEALADKIYTREKFKFETVQALGFSDNDCRFVLQVLIGWFGAPGVNARSKDEFTLAMNLAMQGKP